MLSFGLNDEVVTRIAARSGELFDAAPAVFCCLLLCVAAPTVQVCRKWHTSTSACRNT
jgi:hypothetical protein